MNAWKLWLGCAHGLLPLVLAGCCCDPVAPRSNCGRVVNRPHAARCGQGANCNRVGARLTHRPLFNFEQVCPYGFPPYNPAPLGYMTGAPHIVEASSSRHIEFAPSVVQPSPRQAPAELPPVIDQNAKQLPAEDAAEPRNPLPRKSGNLKSPADLAQPGVAPRIGEPDGAGDESLDDAPSPDAPKQPVSIPAPPADAAPNDLPANPLRGATDGKSPKVDATPPKAELKTPLAPPKAEPKPAAEEERADAPEPKSADEKDEIEQNDSSESDPDDEDWPDAPLPKNELPPLAGPVH